MARTKKIKEVTEPEAMSSAAQIDEPATTKKRGRKPMKPIEKLQAAKARAEEKAKAANLKPVIMLQYQGSEIDMESLIAAVKEDFKREKKRTLITSLTLYVKPEERMGYYVINGNYEGKIPY